MFFHVQSFPRREAGLINAGQRREVLENYLVVSPGAQEEGSQDLSAFPARSLEKNLLNSETTFGLNLKVLISLKGKAVCVK